MSKTARLRKPRKTGTRTGSVTCPSVSGVSKNAGSVVGPGRKGSEDTDVRTNERTDGRFKERPRSSSLFAKIALSAGKILLSQRATVNHRCESTKAGLAAERKEKPITIDRPAKRIGTRGIDAAGGSRKRDKEREDRPRLRTCRCTARGMHYGITT